MKALQRYVLDGVKPGPFEIRVKGPKGTFEERRSVALRSGDNYIQVMLGTRGMLSFDADGMKYYFSPRKGVLLLSIRGAKSEEQIGEIMEQGRMGYEIIPDAAGKITPDDLMLIVSIGEGPETKRNRAELERILTEELPRRGLKGRLSVPVYKGDEPAFGFTDEIIVKFEEGVTVDRVKELAARYDLTVERNVHYLGNAYLLKSHIPPDYGILRLLKKLEENEEVVYAHPNILHRVEKSQYTPNDYLYCGLPHLQVINCDDAWQTLADQPGVNVGGSPDITIAVLDLDGVDPAHADLTGPLSDGTQKMAANFDFVNMNNQTQANLRGEHGTECAGSATALMDNDVGTVGVAPDCHLIGGRFWEWSTVVEVGDIWVWMAGFPTSSTDPNFPTQLTKGADILSNSWAPVWPIPPDPVLGGIFDFLVTYGRGGRGCLVCFAAGNYGYILLDNFNPYAADEKTIAVGASINTNPTNPCDSFHPDHNGDTNNLPAVVDTRSYYSPYGLTVDIVSTSHTCYDLNTGVKIDPILAPVITDTGDIPADAVAQTTLTRPVALGDTVVEVVNTAGFQVNEFVFFNGPCGMPSETKQITAVEPGRITVVAVENAYPINIPLDTGPNDYEFDFGGTSHSCPTVAGAAALLLSVNPELSWTQVRGILRDTAIQIDPNQTNDIGRWIDFDGDNVVEFSQWYGYGRLDVNAALKTAGEGEIMEILKEIRWKRHPHTTAVTKADRKSLVPLLRQTGLERVYMGSYPEATVFDGKHIWVANPNSDNVSKIDVNTNVVVRTVDVGDRPRRLVYDGNYVWVANYNSGDISKIDAESDAVVATIGDFGEPLGLVFDGSFIWVADMYSAYLSKIDIANNNVSEEVVYMGCPPDNLHNIELAFDGVCLWALVSSDYYVGRCNKIDPMRNAIVGGYIVGMFPTGIAFDGTYIWIANSRTGTLSKINDSSGVTETITVGPIPHSIVFDGSHIWVSSSDFNSVSKIDVTTGSVVRNVGVGYEPKGMAFDGTHLWVASTSPPYHGIIDRYFLTKIPVVPLGTEPRSSAINGDI